MLALSQLRIYYDNAHLITGSRHEFGTLKQKSQLLVEMHTAAQPTQQASRQINSLLMTLHSCYLLSIDDNFPIETRHSKDLLLKPMHSRLKINIWCTNVKDVYLVLRIYTD